jgi:hypothetical protein
MLSMGRGHPPGRVQFEMFLATALMFCNLARDCCSKVVRSRIGVLACERDSEFSNCGVSGRQCDVGEVVGSTVDRGGEFGVGAVGPAAQGCLCLGPGDVGFDLSCSLAESPDVRLSDCMPVEVVGGQRVELADLLAEWFEVLFEASDVVDRVVSVDGLVEFEEGAFFGCVGAGAAYFGDGGVGRWRGGRRGRW